MSINEYLLCIRDVEDSNSVDTFANNVYIQGSLHMEKGSPTWNAPIKRGGRRRPQREGEAPPLGGCGRRQYDVWPRAPYELDPPLTIIY